MLLGTLALALTAGAHLWGPVPANAGLATRVEVRRGDRWELVATHKATLPLLRDLRTLSEGLGDGPFRITWSGTFLAARSGHHLVNIASDDGSKVWIDDVLVVDNGGQHPRLWRTGVADLSPGPHTIRIEYEQWAGDAHLETWLRQPGGLSQRLDAIRRRFAPKPPTRVDQLTRTARDWLPWMAVASGCAAWGALLVAGGITLFRTIEREARLPRAGWSLGLTLVVACLPVAAQLLWGLPADGDGWAPDELTPSRLADAIERGFIDPWTSIYPPLHFYVLAPLAVIVELAGAPDGWTIATYPGSFVLHAAMRAVTVLMAAGTLAWLYLIVRLHGTHTQAIAALVAGASCSTLVYYGKTANVDVPYLYWVFCACSCVAAVARVWSPRLVVLGAVTGACAIGTKDQAAGFLLLMPVWLLVIRRGDLRRTGSPVPWRRTILDPVWLHASAAAAATLAAIYLWPWDWTSVARHLEVARRGTYAPMVPGSMAGQLRLLLLELELVTFMLGVPLAAAAFAGLVWVGRRMPALGIAIGVPIASYVGLFLPVIRYTYDRFLLGVALLLACAAGPFCLWLWQQRRWRPATAALGVLAALYTAGHALSGNAMMARDSRYTVEAALDERAARRRERVGLISPRTYLPRADMTPVLDLPATTGDVREWAPDVLLFDRVWISRSGPADADGMALRAAIDDGSLGYGQVGVWQAPVPWWAFQARPGYLTRYSRLGLTNLDKINPRLELWERLESGIASSAPRVRLF